MKFRNGITVDVAATFGETKMMGFAGNKYDEDDDNVIKQRRYTIKTKEQRTSFTVLVKADAGEKDFKYNTPVKLVGVTILSLAGTSNRDANIIVYADDIVSITENSEVLAPKQNNNSNNKPKPEIK